MVAPVIQRQSRPESAQNRPRTRLAVGQGRSRAAHTIARFCLALAVALGGPAAATTVRAGAEATVEIDRAIAEASAKFGLSGDLIRAVLAAESGGRVDAVSPKGAMGLMQLMPATWREMHLELGLGADPFQPRDNILAGASYLRHLHDRFGATGSLAAYNAGPARYQRHLEGTGPLPRETIAYVARVRRQLLLAPLAARRPPIDWRSSGLFVGAVSRDATAEGRASLFAPMAGEGGR
jgi:soluble lytic murein transglycosylase-like protein